MSARSGEEVLFLEKKDFINQGWDRGVRVMFKKGSAGLAVTCEVKWIVKKGDLISFSIYIAFGYCFQHLRHSSFSV